MIALDNGDKIRGDAAAASVVDYTIHGVVGSTITQLADGQLASSIGDLYTASAAVGVSSIILVNTDTSARAVNLYLTPSGGTARRLIPKDLSLEAGYSLHTNGKTIRVMDTTGNLLTGATPSVLASCRVTNTSGQTISDSTVTAITWDTEDFDNGSCHSTSSNTERITVPTGEGGVWIVNFRGNFSSNATGKRIFYIYLDGSEIASHNTTPGVIGEWRATVTAIANVSAGSYFEAKVWQNSGGNLAFDCTGRGVSFSAAKLY